MFEKETYENILARALGQIKTDVLKTEGSLIYNAVSALAFELEKLYIQLDYVLAQADPASADFENLKKMAAQRAIYPASATPATVKVEANVSLPIGTRFSLKSFNYRIDRVINEVSHYYAAVCEQPGAAPNGLTGELIPITYVDGLTSVNITETLIAGSDAEGRDELFKKYMNSFLSQSFAGNVAAYKEKLTSIPGIGGCKVYPVWDGPGTVKLVLQASDYGVVSSYLIEQIQKEICPVPEKGYGFAPVNHNATCESVEAVKVNVSTKITFSSGYNWGNTAEQIKAAIESYLLSLRQTWKDGKETDFITVYISKLESAVLDVQGVVDIQNTMLNTSAANLILKTNQIPTMGEVTVT